jgi:hypothetical protein
MSLAAYQDAYLRLMLYPRDREAWYAGNFPLPGLTPEEEAALRALPRERLEAISSSVNLGRMSVFVATVPATLKLCIEPKRLAAWAEAYAHQYPLAGVYPREIAMAPWLDFLAVQIDQPQLLEVIAYERALLGLQYYYRPQPQAEGLCLSRSAALLVAGPHLPETLQTLWQGQVPALSGPLAPRQGYLLWQGLHSPELMPIHWALYWVLQHLDGQYSWEQVVSQLLAEHPEVADQQTTLLAWEAWLQQRDLLNVPYSAIRQTV